MADTDEPAQLGDRAGDIRRRIVAADGTLTGLIGIADAIKDDAAQAVGQLRDAGLTPIMLTGDNQRTARTVATAVGIDEVLAQVLPSDKAEQVRRLIDRRLDEVTQRITELEQTRSHLQELARQTSELDPADCGGYCGIIQRP